MNSTVQAPPLLAPDPVLPRRDDLLDDALVGARLGELGPPVDSCNRVRARYRPGESLRATFEVTGAEGTRLVSARMFPAAKAPSRFERAREAADGGGAPADAVLLDESLRTVFWVFPQDRKLRGLEDLSTPPPEVRHAFGNEWVRSELVAYTPEKAATFRGVDDGGDTVGFAKVHVDGHGRRSADTLTAVRRAVTGPGAPRFPAVVGYLPDRQLALFTAVPGRSLHQVDRAAVPAAMSALGAALTVLHGGVNDGFPSFTRLTAGSLAVADVVLRMVRPDLAPLTGEVVSALRSSAPPPASQVLLHGDLHPKNVLVHDQVIGLVDLDQAASGPAAAELGGVLARLWWPRPGDEIDPGTASAASAALLSSYERPAADPDLQWYAAAALVVERALRAVNRVDVATLAELDGVLTTARRWARNRKDGRL